MTDHRVIGDRGQAFLARLPLARERWFIGYGFAVAVSLVAYAVRQWVGEGLPPGFPFLTFFPAVILTAFLFGIRPGIVAAVLSGLLAWYFFIAPAHSFQLDGASALALIFFIGVITVDIALIHWMQAANARLAIERSRSAGLAANRELLFRELQHRVSNNIQVVAALLALQKRDIADEHARAALDEASRRLGLIGRIHRKLYDPTGVRIGIAPFLDQLCGDVLEASGRSEIKCVVDADPAVVIDSDAAIPIALIVAEAVSNAVEHGFADRTEGSIAVKLAKGDGGVTTLSITDDGRGLPAGFALEGSNSLGLRIVSTLARQLGGTFEMHGGSGAVARLTLPPAAASA